MLLQGATTFGYSTDLWTGPRVVDLIRHRLRVSYHPSHIGRLLHSLGFSPHKPERRARERDEDGWCWFFGSIDHLSEDIAGWHVAKREDRELALEPIGQGIRAHYSDYATKIGLRLGLRHDWESQYRASVPGRAQVPRDCLDAVLCWGAAAQRDHVAMDQNARGGMPVSIRLQVVGGGQRNHRRVHSALQRAVDARAVRVSIAS